MPVSLNQTPPGVLYQQHSLLHASPNPQPAGLPLKMCLHVAPVAPMHTVTTALLLLALLVTCSHSCFVTMFVHNILDMD